MNSKQDIHEGSHTYFYCRQIAGDQGDKKTLEGRWKGKRMHCTQGNRDERRVLNRNNVNHLKW